jgi:uncharacterized protein YecT (DUF1311 family)
MRRYFPAAALAAVLALHLASASAQADCADTQTEFDDVYCWAKGYIAADDDLNAAYKALTAKLDDNAKAVLKKGQRAWIKTRDGECGRSDSDGYYVDLSCAADFTENRTQFLRDREKECDSGKCDLARLAEVAPSGE